MLKFNCVPAEQRVNLKNLTLVAINQSSMLANMYIFMKEPKIIMATLFTKPPLQ